MYGERTTTTEVVGGSGRGETGQACKNEETEGPRGYTGRDYGQERSSMGRAFEMPDASRTNRGSAVETAGTERMSTCARHIPPRKEGERTHLLSPPCGCGCGSAE